MGHLPELDRGALQRIRQAVKALRRGERRSLPMRQIVDLAGNAPIGAGITIDFEASRDLGNELIVVRVPEARHDSGGAPTLANLSRREQEVAVLIAAGLSNKLIADRLFIATSTVKDHVHHILQKTGLSNRAAVAAAGRAPEQHP